MCCPCFGKAPVNCDEFVCSSFSREYTEFEFVIENLAIRRAPRKLLDIASCCQPKLKSCRVTCNKKCGRDFGGYAGKSPTMRRQHIATPPTISCGPVIGVEDIIDEGSNNYLRDDDADPSSVFCPPSCEREPVYRRPTRGPCHTCNTYYAETSSQLDESMIREILKPQLLVCDDKGSSKIKVSADVHKLSVEDDRPVKIIPTEIKETIDALKVARPLHLSSEVHGKNHRSLIRSLSATSCDKETSCNICDPKAEGDSEGNVPKGKEEKLKRFAKLMKRSSPTKKLNKSSPSTSESTPFPDIIECDEKDNSELQPTDGSVKTREPERPPKAQTLKWKIIINKHKKR